MAQLPGGTVTFLFTDLEVSTELWDRDQEAMRDALALHDRLLRDAVADHNGHVVKGTGDGVHAVFATAGDAVGAAVDAQRAIASTPWAIDDGLRIRVGVHTGVAEMRDGDYFGPAVNRAARLMSVAHGGQIVVSLATEELVRDALPSDVDLVDLGEHRLRGLERSERIFQVQHPELATAFPELRTLDHLPGRLPVVLTSFVGRDREVESVRRALEQGRLVTVIGVGGVGKTRLALQVADQVHSSYPDGVWFCELARVTDRRSVTEFVAASLDVPLRPGEPPQRAVLDHLRRRRLLLVLDNCEHVVDTVGELAEMIAHECSEVDVLATSREALGIDGELLRPVGSLAVPSEGESPEGVRATESVELFADRAEAVRPEFHVDDASARVVADICRQLDGVPLAIELAAARVGSLSVHDIARRLDQRFRLLTGGRRTALERHQTLRATVDWSYDLLDAVDARVFNRLAVFVGGFTAEAAEAIAGDDGVDHAAVFDVLTALVSRSMLDSEAIGASTRFRLHETMRQYARERLDEAGEGERIRRRHAEFYVGVAEDVASGVKGADVAGWMSIGNQESANIDAALEWAIAADDADLALRLALTLIVRPGLPSLARALRKVATMPSARDHALRLEALAYSGVPTLVELGDIAAVAEHMRAVDEVFAEAGLELSAPARFAHAVLASTIGDLDAIREHIEGAIELASAGGDRFLAAFYSATGSTLLSTNGDLDRALELARFAHAVGLELDNATLLGLSDMAMGYGLSVVDPQAALPLVERAVACLRHVEDQAMRYTGERCLARLLAQRGDLEAAAQIYLDVLDEVARTGARMQILLTCESAAVDLTAAGRHEVAATLLGALQRAGAERPTNQMVPAGAAVEALCDDLGADAFAALADRGGAMTGDELVEYLRRALVEVIGREPAR